MTSAREQAREAAWEATGHRFSDDPADAASDVWEQILRELVYLIPYASSVEAITLSNAFDRAREALG